MSKSLSQALLRSSALIILISSSVVFSSVGHASDPLDVVVTAERSEVPLKNTGSAITVITSDEIEKYGSKNIADVLRTVPGLTVAETGGLGATAKVSLRGATPGASMVLLDGVRISDPSNTEGFLDFGNFSAANIERIEVLRGPQSALYGSDAMGGVINIITKKGKRTPVREVTVEAGSYGTVSARGSMSGATDDVSYALGVNVLHSNGFPRYGYRVNVSPLYPLYPYLSPEQQSSPNPTNDPVDKAGLNGNVTYRVNENITVETGFAYYSNAIQFDNSEAFAPTNVYNKNNRSKAEILNGHVKTKFSSFDGALNSQFTVFGNQTTLDNWLMELDYAPHPTDPTLPWYSGYTGKRIGAEYQGEVQLPGVGPLLFGARRETEFALSALSPEPLGYFATDKSQTTNSAFIQKRFALSDRIDASLGGRVDAIENSSSFSTWRSTVAYRIDESRTKLRGAIGTGAKSPTLLQLYSTYGTPDLRPEKSFGYELGIDQEITSGINLSATIFNEDFSDRIGFGSGCRFNVPPKGCYYNIKNSQSRGIELAATFEVVPDKWRAGVSYTLMDAKDKDTQKQLYRIPRETASLTFAYLGVPKWEFEPRLTYVGARLDEYFLSGPPWSAVVTLPAYLKVDFDTRYKINDSNTAYIRFENLTDAHTEDAYYYGSAGRSVYVGWTSRW